ncbi:MAG: acetyltransferase [Bacillota bacterium]|jgi:sugar O-acyltransferase (sialic acid O-acetyltransferase NeuD family)
MRRPLVIIGAGGFGREVAWLVDEINCNEPTWELLGFADDYSSGVTVEGFNILGGLQELLSMKPRPNVVCAIGDSLARRTVVERYAEHGFDFVTMIHPTVRRSRFVEIGPGSVICAGSILTTNVRIGSHSILNLNCKVGHDSVLGAFSSLMPATNIAGEVRVGDGCYFGLNAAVINQVSIGDWTIIGAGAVVVNDIPSKVVAVGVPAKPIKQREL